MKTKRKDKQDHNWIESAFSFGDQLKIPRILFSLVFITIPIILLFLPFIITRETIFAKFSFRMWFGFISGGIWIWLGPYFISRYCKDLNLLFENMKKSEIACDENIDSLKEKSINHFLTPDLFNVFWVCIILAAAVFDLSYLFRFGIIGINDLYLYIFCIVLAYILYFTSIGFKGVIITIRLVGTLVKNDMLHINFFHADKAGGFQCINQFIRSTTRLFGSGVLFLPILLDYIIFTNSIWVKTILYIAIFFFSICIFLSFYYPVKKLYTYENWKKNEYLEQISDKYKRLITMCLDEGCKCSAEDEIEALNMYYFISRVDETTVFKVRTDIVFQMVTALVIPLFCFFVNSSDILKLAADITNYFN